MLVRQHEENDEHDDAYESFQQLENEVDSKVEDALRNAANVIGEAEDEVVEVEEMLGDQGVLLERIRIEREGFSAEQQM